MHTHPSAKEDRRAQLRHYDERIAVAFWIVLLSGGASFATTIGSAYLHIDATQLEAGAIGAFLGSSPIILMPLLVRVAYGEASSFANHGSIEFRALTLLRGALSSAAACVIAGRTTKVTRRQRSSIAGGVTAIFASWFWPHLPAAVRIWMRRQLTLPRPRGEGGKH